MESYGRLITVSEGLRFMQELQDGYKLVKGREFVLQGKHLEAGVMKHAVLLIPNLGIKSKSMYGMCVVRPAWDTQTITWKRRVINALHKISSKTLYLNFCDCGLRGQGCASTKWQALEFISLKRKTSRCCGGMDGRQVGS